ncbi:MFS transporter [Leucobacter allii]|uniref:MFS transporter n=1 Tax=Leucobacter allii TaxID=2932247 RepID=A0ABY4FMR3_9MICO|nr:MFS transporter [Leucobacter allii]UOQ57525.1 MFS transporter [Leucobacter allii]
MTAQAGGPSSAVYRSSVAALVFACLVAGMMQTMVIPLQGEFPRLLDAEPSATAWIVTANTLSACAFSPIGGKLGDLFGRTRVAVILMLVFSAGSIIAAASAQVEVLVAGRALQGVAITVIPLSMSILQEIMPVHRVATGVALASGMLGAGAAIGMPLGAAVTRVAGWQAMFWVCAVLGFVSVVWMHRAVPRTAPAERGARFDLLGALGLMLGSSALLIALSQSLSWGAASFALWGVGGAALLVLVATNLWMLRAASPLIDVRVAWRPQVVRTNAAALALNFAMMGANVAIPQLLVLGTGIGYGLSPLAASFVMMVTSAAQVAATPVIARWSRRSGPRVVLAVGSAAVVVALGAPALWPGPLWFLVGCVAVLGFGFALAFGAVPQLVMAAVPPHQVAAANGLNTQIRTFGTAWGAALIGAILAATATAGWSAERGFLLAFLVSAGAAFAAVVIALLIPRAGCSPAAA